MSHFKTGDQLMNLEKILSLLLPLFVAIAGSIPGILAYLNQRPRKTTLLKEKAEAVDIIVDSSTKVIEALSKRIDILEEEKDGFKKMFELCKSELEQKIKRLERCLEQKELGERNNDSSTKNRPQ
jgi:hypothetical protein